MTLVMRAARKCLVKEWQKKELDEEEWFSRKKQMEEKKKTGEWLPPTDNVTALERQGSSIPRASTQYTQVFHTQVQSTRKYSAVLQYSYSEAILCWASSAGAILPPIIYSHFGANRTVY